MGLQQKVDALLHGVSRDVAESKETRELVVAAYRAGLEAALTACGECATASQCENAIRRVRSGNEVNGG